MYKNEEQEVEFSSLLKFILQFSVKRNVLISSTVPHFRVNLVR